MLLLLLFQQVFLLAIARQVKGHISPRTFRFQGEIEGEIGGCNEADIRLILEELEFAKEAAEFAAKQLTKYPFFQAFQEPNAFGKKELENTGKEVFTRIAALLDGFHKDDKFTIECRTKRCKDWPNAVATTWPINDPVVTFCPRFFETETSTEVFLERYKKAVGQNRNYVERWPAAINMRQVSHLRFTTILHELAHTTHVSRPIKELLRPKNDNKRYFTKDYCLKPSDCYNMARGYHKTLTEGRESPEVLIGARKAARNAESWALIASGMYISKQLRIKHIPIPGIEDYRWEDIRMNPQ